MYREDQGRTYVCAENAKGSKRKYRHTQTVYVNTYKTRSEVVTEHAHTDRNTCNTLARFLVQREIVGVG